LFSNGKFNGTIDVVAPVSTQILMSSLPVSSSAQQLKVVGWGVARQCRTRLLFIKVLPEAADKILNKNELVVTVA
jgi:hypothetical protein